MHSRYTAATWPAPVGRAATNLRLRPLAGCHASPHRPQPPPRCRGPGGLPDPFAPLPQSRAPPRIATAPEQLALPSRATRASPLATSSTRPSPSLHRRLASSLTQAPSTEHPRRYLAVAGHLWPGSGGIQPRPPRFTIPGLLRPAARCPSPP